MTEDTMTEDTMTGHQAASRVWFITGTSSGFGRALSRAVLARGERVVATARDLAAVTDLLEIAPDRVLTARLDVTDPPSVRAAVAAALATFGRIDVLVNNAAYGLLGAFEELTDAQLRHEFETNFFGALAVTREVLPALRRQRSGHIVQMSSVNGVVPGPGGTAYVGSKFALEGMSESLAGEIAHLGIGVTIVEAGPFRTEFGGRGLVWGEPLADYAALMGPARAAFEASHGSQPGDPDRGAEAFSAIRGYLGGRLAGLDVVEPAGADTAFRALARHG